MNLPKNARMNYFMGASTNTMKRNFGGCMAGFF